MRGPPVDKLAHFWCSAWHRGRGVKRTAAPKLGAYAGLTGLGLLGALVLGRPELVVLAAPFAALLFLGLAGVRQPDFLVSLELDRERAIEGDEITIRIDLEARTPIERLELHVPLPKGLEVIEGANPVTLHLGYDEERTVELKVRCNRWGAYIVGELFLRAHDRLDLFAYEGTLDRRTPLKVYPHAEQLRSLITRSRRRSSPATRSRERREKASSSPTCASSSTGTRCAGSTGGRARGAATSG